MEHPKFYVDDLVKEIYKGRIGKVTREVTLDAGAQSVWVDFGDGQQLSYSSVALCLVDAAPRPVDPSTWNDGSSIDFPSIELTRWVRPYPKGRGDARNPPKAWGRDVDPAHSNLIRSSSECLSKTPGSLGARLNFGA